MPQGLDDSVGGSRHFGSIKNVYPLCNRYQVGRLPHPNCKREKNFWTLALASPICAGNLTLLAAIKIQERRLSSLSRFRRVQTRTYREPLKGRSQVLRIFPAVAYHFCLNLPAAFSQPGNSLLEVLCTQTDGRDARIAGSHNDRRLSDVIGSLVSVRKGTLGEAA